MCSDGIYDFVNNDEDLMCFIIKIVLTIVQMVIFSGALIGFTTDLLSSTFDKRLENKGKMYLANHYVFLNWSTIGQNIIYDLSFLDGNKTVVILTDDDREEVMTSIDNIFTSNNRKKKGLRIFVKKGNPTSIKHLSDVSIDKAKYIGVLLQNCENEDSDYTISTKDLAYKSINLFFMNTTTTTAKHTRTRRALTASLLNLTFSTNPCKVLLLTS